MATIKYLTTTLPDYFQGYHGKTLIAFHWKGQTIREALDDLRENALSEDHGPSIFAAIDELFYSAECEGVLGERFMDEKYITFSEGGDSGLIHYFGVSDDEHS